ncbi:MAG: JAB domain-containing protein [Nitrospirota bacterium]
MADSLLVITIVGGFYTAFYNYDFGLPAIVILLIVGIISYISAPIILSSFFYKYKAARARIKDILKENELLHNKTKLLYGSVPKRFKGSRFKSHYGLAGHTIDEFEKILAIGMWHEKKEVFVTALCNNGNVLKVTATIGSAFSCRPSDNANAWFKNATALNCDEIRQYHNHPINNNSTSPSMPDIRTSKLLKKYFKETNLPFRSFIIYWNKILEYKILEYSGSGEYEIVTAFDVSKTDKTDLASISAATASFLAIETEPRSIKKPGRWYVRPQGTGRTVKWPPSRNGRRR